MHLIFDFDGTITQKDTISEVARSAIAFQKHTHGHDLQETWDQVVKDYVDDCKQMDEDYPEPEHERKAVVDELKYLSRSKELEEISLGRVARSGIFKGLSETTLVDAGVEARRSGKVKIRHGFEELMDLAEQQGWPVGVISVNWSRSFIQGVLQPRELHIVANEPSQTGEVHGPECLGARMTNGCEKIKALKHLVGKDDKAIYFGDSTTDMECLLQGGVVISDNGESTLLKTLKRVEVNVPHVSERTGGERISWARDFGEVLRSSVLND